MTGARTHPNYVVIWYWLLGLALASGLVSVLPVPHTFAVVLVFTAATVKAVLVALYYMRLRFERRLVYGLVLAPLVLGSMLLLVLWPEMVRH